jgi:LysR family transcriptional activator of nhaA
MIQLMADSWSPHEWLNYQHLLYFWLVAREGGVKPAASRVRRTHSTISTQVHALAEALGEPLFVRQGRRLVLTDTGRLVYRYADEIFGLGRELVDAVKDRPTGRPIRLQVGVADVLPKLAVHRLLAPARRLPEGIHLVCREGKADRLLADLSTHELDLVLADAAPPPGNPVRAFTHDLGDCGVTFFAAPRLARQVRGPLPGALASVPLLLPTDNTSLRRAIDQWLHRAGIRPQVIGEFEDAALLEVFGADGMGVFPAPSLVADSVGRQHQVQVVGQTEEVRQRFFALSMARRLEHPAVVAISAGVRSARRAAGKELSNKK